MLLEWLNKFLEMDYAQVEKFAKIKYQLKEGRDDDHALFCLVQIWRAQSSGMMEPLLVRHPANECPEIKIESLRTF